ncbi:MAG: NUDIX hydrolase [Flavobacteriia bacterium]|jgi:8-oxo-dGTP diphosphatase
MRKFNIRVYGLLINDKNEILVSDEQRNGFQFTKFPGGGLEWGEGITDALKREFIEELNLEIEIGELFYLTDFFQVSAFNPKDQIISIYYRVNCKSWETINSNPTKVFIEHKENHRWIELGQLNKEDLTFPIDKVIVEKLT